MYTQMNLANTSVILLIASIQLLGTSIAVIAYYNSTNKVKDARYTWTMTSLIVSLLSLLMGILAYFHWYIYGVFEAWVLLLTFFNLIITVIGIAVFKSNDSLPIAGWIVAIITCLVLNGWAGIEILTLSSS